MRIVWGTEDRLLPWPSAAARFRDDWLPHADWVELDGVGHCPQLDVPLEAAQLILGFTAGARGVAAARGMYHGLARLLHMGAGRPAIASAPAPASPL